MRCPHCQANNQPTAQFCLNCGAALINRCTNCQLELPPGSRFCMNCGTPVADLEVPQIRTKAVPLTGGKAYKLGNGVVVSIKRIEPNIRNAPIALRKLLWLGSNFLTNSKLSAPIPNSQALVGKRKKPAIGLFNEAHSASSKLAATPRIIRANPMRRERIQTKSMKRGNRR